MTILVTGSSGHLGEALVRMLRAEGRAVRGLDVRPSAFTDVVGSIADAAVCASAVRDVSAVLHTATLHKPHVATHSRQDFVDTNITGTLNLLEASAKADVEAFVFTSTTSAFGDSLKPGPGEPAVWIDETVPSIPKNIYGATKTAAEDLCQLFWKLHKLPTVVLRVSRFFPEDDDSPAVRAFCSSDNAKTNELLYRRGDIHDMATAHLAAIEAAPGLGFDRFVITATSPFGRGDLAALARDPAQVVGQYFPTFAEVYERHGWKMFSSIGRVYRNDRARDLLAWEPAFGFAEALKALDRQEQLGSELSRNVGVKGYHGSQYRDGLYPVELAKGPEF